MEVHTSPATYYSPNTKIHIPQLRTVHECTISYLLDTGGDGDTLKRIAQGRAFGRITRGRLATSVDEVHSFVGYGCVLVCIEREGVIGRSNRYLSAFDDFD